MKKFALVLLLFSLFVPDSLLGRTSQSANRILNSAKLDTFDEKWNEALIKLKELQQLYPDDDAAVQASFWEALCLDKIGKSAEAINQYESFLRRAPASMPQVKQAEFSIVRLSCQLYKEGNRRYIDRALQATESRDADLRLLAGVQISYLSDSRINRKAVPGLLDFMEKSSDPEIQNQAALALLRIDPKILDDRTGKGSSARKTSGRQQNPAQKSTRKYLRLSIIDEGTESFRFSLPLSLARMLFSSLPEDARESLEEEGINPENILEELEKADEMLEIKAGGQTFKIWVE